MRATIHYTKFSKYSAHGFRYIFKNYLTSKYFEIKISIKAMNSDFDSRIKTFNLY